MNDVIKSFLVGLGFGVDETTLAKFNKAIVSASIKVTALYASVQAAAAGIFLGISKISDSFESMGYELRIVAPAVNKFLVLRQAMLTAYAKAGVNLSKVVQQSILFNYSLAKTKFALEAAYKSVAAKFFPLLTKQLDIFRLKIFANMPKIQATLEKMVKFIFKAFEAVTELGHTLWSILTRVWGFFEKLHDATNGWSTAILAALAAWRLLNLGFLATPLGMILSLGLAILALYDDFKVWSEGGKSLINWGSDATRMIVGLTAAVASLAVAWGIIKGATTAYSVVLKAYEAIQAGVNLVMLANPIGLIIAAVAALTVGLTYLDSKWQLFGGHLSGFFTGVGGKILDWLSGANSSAASAAIQPAPIIPQSAGVKQNINQETNITVQGSADAHATGKAVANQQDRVNFDMTRNMKGAVQ